MSHAPITTSRGRAFPGRDQGQLDNGNGQQPLSRDKEPHKADMPLIPEWMSSPLAGVLSARSGSMAYRNDAQIERLKKVLVVSGRDENFVSSFVFENHVESDLSDDPIAKAFEVAKDVEPAAASVSFCSENAVERVASK